MLMELIAGPSSYASASTTTTVLVNPGNFTSTSVVGSTTVIGATTLVSATTLITGTGSGSQTAVPSPIPTVVGDAADSTKPFRVVGIILLGAAMIL
ncbi:MAG: hypothetical protein CL912_13310 [Deltaproteobacteria bacterium]|nr:hypothetical protein [Deltaproteobacteria bacterium]|tara:strand:- start:1116 stop:1403 length:288 start_codon:yes stop_codon:yes gene_type:complete